MTPEQKLAALKEMCERATKGPWKTTFNSTGARCVTTGERYVVSETSVGRTYHREQMTADLDFIAASRTLLPAALKIIEEVGEMHKAEPRDMQRTGARGQFCVECYSAPWPCPTRRLIDAFWEEVKI